MTDIVAKDVFPRGQARMKIDNSGNHVRVRDQRPMQGCEPEGTPEGDGSPERSTAVLEVV